MPRRETKFSDISVLLLLLIGSAKAALFDGCDQTRNINAGATFNLRSPNYPNNYAPSSSCRYKFTAPLDYVIKISCTMDLDKNPNGQCSSEFLYVDREGDVMLRGAEFLCGTGTFVRRSMFRSIVLAFESRGSWGKFHCQVKAETQFCDCGWSVNTKIINGVEANVNEFPSIVAFKDTTYPQLSPFCGGTIITHRFILTTTSCARVVPNASKVMALVGQHDLDVPNRYAAQYAILLFVEHLNFNNYPRRNDLAIARTVASIDWSRGVGPACLLPLYTTERFVDQIIEVAGWGTTSYGGPTTNKLQKIILTIQNDMVCQSQYTTTNAHICTKGVHEDTGRYDWGGPNYIRVGLRQFVIGCISFGNGWGSPNALSVNTRLTSHLDWIYDTIGYSSCMVALR